MSRTKIGVIILNFNGWQDTIACLASVYQSNYSQYQVIVVDNGSQDDSLGQICDWARVQTGKPASKFSRVIEYTRQETEEVQNIEEEDFLKERKLIIIKNEKNYGFAEGNNIGMRYALKDKEITRIALFNSDVKIAVNCLREMVQTLDSAKAVGSCQPKMFLMDESRIIDALGMSFDQKGKALQVAYGIKDSGQYSVNQEIFGACAGAVLYKKEMLEQIGFFDEEFFAYYEDVDLALRARLAGWKTMYAGRAIVYHKHSATLGENSPFKRYLIERNRYYYTVKNFPFSMMIKFLSSRPTAIMITVFKLIKGKKFALLRPVLKGNLEALKNIAGFFKKRKEVQAAKLIEDKELKRWFK